MRQLLTILMAGVFVLGATPVVADPGHELPVITVTRWADPPVTAADPDCQDPDCHEEILIIRAHDPDSSITEVQVWFGEGAPFVFAHTGCVQGSEPGTRARLEIGVSYREAGSYTVKAVAYSHLRCLAHERGDGHPLHHSRVARLETEVAAPE
jgi:hypothetical protein